MNNHDMLLAAILADPEDDTVRLAYADALQERNLRGDFVRSTFVRAGCHPNCDGSKRAPKSVRRTHRTLLEAHAAEWIPIHYGGRIYTVGTKMHAGEVVYSWRRGFVEAISCPANWWVVHANNLLAKHPVVFVRISSNPDRVGMGRVEPSTAGDDTRYSYQAGKDYPWFDERNCVLMAGMAPVWHGLFKLTWPNIRRWRFPPAPAFQTLYGIDLAVT